MGRIIGSGDLASALKESKRKDLTFFASGVSDSRETRFSEFKREMNLLMLQPQNAHLVYFSTLSRLYTNTPYTEHKKAMETVIKAAFPRHCIIRIGNIDWGKNPNTLINYLKAHPEAEIQDVYRYIVSKEELLYWVDLIPPWSLEMHIPGRRMKVKEIKEIYASNARPHTAKV